MTDASTNTYDDLLAAYAALGVRRGSPMFVTSDLCGLMRYKEPGAEALLDARLRAFLELLLTKASSFPSLRLAIWE